MAWTQLNPQILSTDTLGYDWNTADASVSVDFGRTSLAAILYTVASLTKEGVGLGTMVILADDELMLERAKPGLWQRGYSDDPTYLCPSMIKHTGEGTVSRIIELPPGELSEVGYPLWSGDDEGLQAIADSCMEAEISLRNLARIVGLHLTYQGGIPAGSPLAILVQSGIEDYCEAREFCRENRTEAQAMIRSLGFDQQGFMFLARNRGTG